MSRIARIGALVYGVTVYSIFFVTFLYLIGFVTNLVVPKSIDSGEGAGLAVALLVNAGLLLVFALQHSVMARPGFKAWLTRRLPRPVERSTYVLASSLALILLYWQWQPIASPALWNVEGSLLGTALVAGSLLGFGIVLYSTFLIDHFDLFGLRQVFLAWKGMPYTNKRFMTPGLYRFIRHPLYVGWFVAFWCTPAMTLGHLLFAAVNTGYILVAIGYEERDLAAQLGPAYRRWRERTPKFVPRLGGAPAAAETGIRDAAEA